MTYSITVKDRKENELVSFQAVEMTTTVQDFKKKFLEECDFAKKKKLSAPRLRFTVGSARG